MVSIPDGSFRNWQDTDIIKATEYVQERELLRSAINYNNVKLSNLEASTEAVQLGNAQLQKITNDAGNSKLMVSSTSEDILDTIKNEGIGLHTFYAVSGSKNLPPTNVSIRGIANITSANPTHGYVWATDYKNNFFYNYIVNDVWLGWDGPSIQKELWTHPGWFMTASQTANPSKKLSDCRTGWVLVWSDYNNDTKTVNDSDFVYTHIPKYASLKYPGKQTLVPITNYVSDTSTQITAKKLFIHDDGIVGHDDNAKSATATNDVVLRAVLEY